MKSLEAVFHFFKCKGHTAEATTTFSIMDRVAVLQCEEAQIAHQTSITDYYTTV